MSAVVKVKYFAILREMAGKREEEVVLENGDNGQALYYRLAEKYHFPLKLSDIRLAVNDTFVTTDTSLKAGDEIVFIPPVAGG